MSNTKQHVQQPKVANTEELAALIHTAQERYKTSHAAAHRVDKPILKLFIEEVVRLIEEGYSLHPSLPAGSHPQSFVVYMAKPQEMLNAELEQVAKDVEEKYLADIEAFNKQQQDLLAEQLYQQQIVKERKAQEEKERKAREKAAAEAADYYQSLITKQQESK